MEYTFRDQNGKKHKVKESSDGVIYVDGSNSGLKHSREGNIINHRSGSIVQRRCTTAEYYQKLGWKMC